MEFRQNQRDGALMGKTYRGDEARQAQEETDSARESLLNELDQIFDDAKVISCTRLTVAIEALIDAKIKWRS